ncbi:MAG: hypothetical protein V1808_03680 [Candidatus Daviesbacteria bacterium]
MLNIKGLIKNIPQLFALISIISLGCFLYIYRIGDIPPGLALDEVTHGYNAYSILLTGKDEYGKMFPTSFRFFTAFTPPLYTYLTIPMVKIFGMNIVATRMTSVLSGIFAILIMFLLLKKLNVINYKITTYLGVLLYTISPWSIMYSRSGYEAMLSFLIYSLGILFIWIGFKKPLFLTIGIMVMSISIYASHTNKFLVPLLFLGLIIIFKNIFIEKRNIKFILLGLIGAFIIQIPNLLIINTQSFLAKGNLFYNDTLFAEFQKLKDVVPTFISVPYVFLREFFSQYLTYFSFRSLFLDPDPFQARSIPDLSVFYPWMFIPYLVGLYTAWIKRNMVNYKFLLLLAFIAPVPAALAKDPFWTYRAIPLLLPLIIFVSIGIDRILSVKIKIILSLICVLILYSLIILWKGYFILLPNERAEAWQFGYQQLAQEINLNKNDMFVIDNTRRPQAYLEIAFFLNLSPQQLQTAASQEIKNDYYNNTKIYTDYSFENIEIRAIAWKTDIYKNQILIGDNLTFSESQISEHELTNVFKIKNFLGDIIFAGYRTNPYKKCLQDKHNKKLLFPICNTLLNSGISG